MPTYLQPGSYVGEIRTPAPIMALPSDVTAFVGHCETGPIGQPTTLYNLADFERQFGATTWPGGHLPLSVALFFANGGRQAEVLRAEPGSPLSAEHLAGALLPRLEGRGVTLLCLPPERPADALPAGAVTAAQDWCERHHALLLVDPPPDWSDAKAARAGHEALAPRSGAAALYFPRLRVAGSTLPVVPCGAVAGVLARTDAQRGVWRSAAGTEAALLGITGLTLLLTKAQQEQLNPANINALRFLQNQFLVWGGRTRSGDPAQRYIAVTRLRWLIEDSIRQGLAWTASERNGAAVWSLVRERVDGFLRRLHRDGALAGEKESEAYFVRCDQTTMTAADLAEGRLVCELGLAFLRPAEFTVIRVVLAVTPAA